MATLTVVITYSGTEPAEEVSSFTSAGTAYGSITAANMKTTLRLLRKAYKRGVADHASDLQVIGI